MALSTHSQARGVSIHVPLGVVRRELRRRGRALGQARVHLSGLMIQHHLLHTSNNYVLSGLRPHWLLARAMNLGK